MSDNQASDGIKIYGGSARKEMFELHKTVSDKPRQLDRSLLVMLCTHAETANAIADRLEELEAENAALKVQVRELIATMEEEGEMDAVRIADLKKENTALRAKVAEQGLSLACLADGILGEDAADRSDQALVRFGCQLARDVATLRAALNAQMQYHRDLRADRDRLDSRRMRLMVHVQGDVWKTHEFVDVDLRAAIDAARKEAQ